MILSTANSQFQFQYNLTELISKITKATYYKARQRKGAKGESLIEDQGVDEEDKVFVQTLIESGSKKVFAPMLFLTVGIVGAYSFDEVGTPSEGAIVMTILHKDNMIDNIETVIDQYIYDSILNYSLRDWYMHNGMYDDAKVSADSYIESMNGLNNTIYERKKPL